MTSTLPAWFQARQQAAQKRYEETPTPKRGDEQWRFANIKQLKFDNLSGEAVEADASDLIARSTGLESPVAKFVFINDQVVLTESSLPETVICLSLADALEKHPELVEAHFMKQETRLGSAKYAALHEASVKNGLFIHVPDGVVIEGTIEAHHWISGETTVFPHTLIVTGKSAEVRVIDIFHSAEDTTPGLAIAFNDLCAGQNSSLDYIAIQELNEVSRIISINETSTARDARAKGFILNTGAAWARNESLSRLEGENSRSDMLSVSIPDHVQEYDQRTFQHHVSPSANSDLLYKNTLYGHSKTVFSGLIFVGETAHHTDAYQTCRNLFMSNDCEANSMPGLEINADQVACSHGSTSAQIADEEIFYLQARGIHPTQARQLIARGYSVEAVARLENEEVEDLLMKFIDSKFARIK
ncbi:MAG: SufD family Fe-S cluster assembly protein [Akkermansiaceae bacterium]|jgi:Fe-S cluster assembly protein SufD|nr:SufD family Fe-S cluster assembly protein [Akkermansiaceae bacterium]MDP4647456.1 SufD family Fe-S cluster assembly protein [Akkermansiaceae bacterium]MDP4719808.1 SufD family Fe-S cluster assembly protein [Akkermansiaceae bacterium]MDP4780994.1 SufD family Fe-S cluster assembly protein [Akkermansiaceae bacterium]MDP4847707.1 SufD family Fe-S cluster assembly protein [Akkermansiaceae bacterium]